MQNDPFIYFVHKRRIKMHSLHENETSINKCFSYDKIGFQKRRFSIVKLKK